MNAIITAATGYFASDLQIFLDSVERNCTNTKVFLIVFQRDRKTVNDLRSKYPFIEPIYIRKRYYREIKIAYSLACFLSLNRKNYLSINPLFGFIGRSQLHIALGRFFIALQIIKSLKDSFSKVLLTDSRDVFIQKDPFSLVHEKLVSGVETTTIGTCSYNSSWIKEIYGDDVLNELSDKPIVCAGVTLGPTGEVEKYLMEMCSEMWKYLPQVKTSLGSDQAVHNYLIRHNKIVTDLVDNQSGFIATLYLENPRNILADASNGSIMVHGKYPAIVHQYDRHPSLMALF
jgi:hypothetical protein